MTNLALNRSVIYLRANKKSTCFAKIVSNQIDECRLLMKKENAEGVCSPLIDNGTKGVVPKKLMTSF
jgi:hypothetical protein